MNNKEIFSQDFEKSSEFLKAVYRKLHLSYPKFFKMDNLAKLGLLSAELLLQDTDIIQKYKSEKTGIILLNSSSSLETDEKHQETIDDRAKYFPSPSVFVYTLANIMAGEMAIRHKLRGENSVFIFEKPDPEFIHSYVTELFALDKVECVLSGWVECYHERLESCLFLVERDPGLISSGQASENIIFDPKSISQLFNETVLK